MLEKQFKPKLVNVYNYPGGVKEVIEVDFKGYGNFGGRRGNKSCNVSIKDRERNLKRIKRNVRRLAFANNLGQVHMILTYAENMQDVEKSDYHFKMFIFQLRKLYPNLKYIATRELQRRGAIHYHCLLNQRISIKEAQRLWFHGWVSLVQHKNKMQAVMYVLKYISKEVGEVCFVTSNGHTKKAYLSSQGLKRELEGCIARFLINRPDAYDSFQDFINEILTNYPFGWDLSFEVRISDNEVFQGRSILRCSPYD